MLTKTKVSIYIALLVLIVSCQADLMEPFTERAISDELSEMIDRSEPIFNYHAQKVVKQSVDSKEIEKWTQKNRREIEKIYEAVESLKANEGAITSSDIAIIEEIISKSDLPSAITQQIITPLAEVKNHEDKRKESASIQDKT